MLFICDHVKTETALGQDLRNVPAFPLQKGKRVLVVLGREGKRQLKEIEKGKTGMAEGESRWKNDYFKSSRTK